MSILKSIDEYTHIACEAAPWRSPPPGALPNGAGTESVHASTAFMAYYTNHWNIPSFRVSEQVMPLKHWLILMIGAVWK